MLVFKPRDSEANRVSFYANGSEVVVEADGLEVEDSEAVLEVFVDEETGEEMEVEAERPMNVELIAALRSHPEVEEVFGGKKGKGKKAAEVEPVAEEPVDAAPDEPQE